MSSANSTLPPTDVDALIEEVHNRPALWNKNSKKYRDKLLKARLWYDVCGKTIPNWIELSSRDKKMACLDVQKKWRNLRDTFNKELANQQRNEKECGTRRKRLYVHFKALSFLASQPKEKRRSTALSYQATEDSHSNEPDNGDEWEEVPTQNPVNLTPLPQYPDMANQNVVRNKEFEMVEFPADRKTYDEDVSFSEMLVPLMRKLNDDQKHYAKIEILQIMNRAKRLCPSDPQIYVPTLGTHIVNYVNPSSHDPLHLPFPSASKVTPATPAGPYSQNACPEYAASVPPQENEA